MENRENSEEKAAQWIARRDSAGWNEERQAQLDAWIGESASNRVAYLRLNAAWEHASRLKALGAGVSPGIVPAPHELEPVPLFGEKSNIRPAATRSYAALAASIVLAVVLGAGWFLWWSGRTAFSTPVGGIATVPMSDGSKVILNTDSAIRIAMTETERVVKLAQGEAFFEVAQDSRRPFVVEAGERRIIAVGTRFSVRKQGGDVQVVVTEGRVRVESIGGVSAVQLPAQLKAGSIARTGGAGVLVQERPLREAEELLAWRSGFVAFHQVPLAEAVAELNRYNPRKIVIDDPAVAAIRIGGNFRTTNVDAFVRLLEAGFPVKVAHRGDEVVLAAR